MDFNNTDVVGIQISADGQRVWICVDGACALRVKGIRGSIEIRDDRLEDVEDSLSVLDDSLDRKES